MRRGFKTEAKAIAREVRDEMSLAPTSCLDPWRLAEHLCIPVIPMSSFIAAEPEAVRFYQNEGEAMFSGVTVFRGTRRTVVFNDAHAPGRQSNDIVHELGHGLLGHSPTAAMDEFGCRLWDQEMEDEAHWLSSALLVPEEAALLIVRRGWLPERAAGKYGVSRRMIQWRVNATAARKRVQRMRAKRANQAVVDERWS